MLIWRTTPPWGRIPVVEHQTPVLGRTHSFSLLTQDTFSLHLIFSSLLLCRGSQEPAVTAPLNPTFSTVGPVNQLLNDPPR